MKKLLLLTIFVSVAVTNAQSIDQTLLTTFTDENNGKFEKTNFYSVVFPDGSKEVIKTTVESYNTIISRDNFVRYYPVIVENTIYEIVNNIKLLKLIDSTSELPILILNFKLNRNGVTIEINDSAGPKVKFKNWAVLEKIIKSN